MEGCEGRCENSNSRWDAGESIVFFSQMLWIQYLRFTVLFVFPFKQKIWDLDDIEDASEKICAIAKERYKGWRASFSSTYKAYSTDAQRMKHKPEDLDNVEWYYLIQYFGSERF